MRPANPLTLGLVSLALLAAAASLAAQAPSGAMTVTIGPLNGPATTTIVVSPPAPSCPVQMHALQGVGGGLLAARNGQPVDGPAQRIHLILTRLRTAQVTSAHLRVRGLSGRNRALEALSIDGVKPDRTQTLDVTFTAQDAANAAADLFLPGFTAVQTIELQSITYADGTTWKLASGNACQIAPDPLVRIEAR